MVQREYSYETTNLIQSLPEFANRGITELVISDKSISKNKKYLLELIDAINKKAPDLFVTLSVDVSVIDKTFVNAVQKIFCTIDIPLLGTEKVDTNVNKNGCLLFDKKLYSTRADLLNNNGLVFGFDMEWGLQTGDTAKAFRDRLDFAISLYPNHIFFSQLEDKKLSKAESTGIFSSKDIEFCRDLAFACKVFYTEGRAVPWFNCVLEALKISPSAFFADFAEWQRFSSCSYESNFDPESIKHIDIEKMQLVFLREKFDEKNKITLWSAVEDIVKLNGAFSRVAGEGEETIIETSYNPDDILSPQSVNLSRFCDNTCLESCRVRVFEGEDSPDYKIL